jgi:hypothetical protein
LFFSFFIFFFGKKGRARTIGEQVFVAETDVLKTIQSRFFQPAKITTRLALSNTEAARKHPKIRKTAAILRYTLHEEQNKLKSFEISSQASRIITQFRLLGAREEEPSTNILLFHGRRSGIHKLVAKARILFWTRFHDNKAVLVKADRRVLNQLYQVYAEAWYGTFCCHGNDKSSSD